MGTRILCGTTDKRWHENTATLTRSALNEEHAQYNWAAIDEESTGYLRDTQDNTKNLAALVEPMSASDADVKEERKRAKHPLYTN